MACWCRNM
jgi:hypothetical protein